jgi:D-lactate dehydrogenase
VLVDTRRAFREIEVLDGGARVRVQPGVTLRAVNARLARYGRRLGPDPASEAACTLGGVIANNSSGMTCGTERNTARTLDSAEIVLVSGTVIDTGAAGADAALLAREPALHAGLVVIRDELRGDPALVAEVRRQFSLKNTMGYSLDAFLDETEPARILARLMVGSEGTLGFVARAVLRTVPIAPHAATGLLVLPDLATAVAALPSLIGAEAAAIELLDAASLRVAQADARAAASLRALTVGGHAALLVEWQEPDAETLRSRVADATPVLRNLGAGDDGALTSDPAARAALWSIRKGLYAAVAGARAAGTTALLEDIAVPVPALVETCGALTELFARHVYRDAVIFGHARDGNLHFMLTERFTPGEVPQRHAAFMDEMVDLVLGHGGTLKAEHGTGRVMAPFVARQYGDALYGLMVRVKRLLDPAGILSPGVVIGEDAAAHLHDLKVAPAVEAEVDRCVECGYCEPVCPSRDLTTTPRQRIVLRRERARAEAAGDLALVRELDEAAAYDVVQTCAADGMCATACPVGIDTGELVKHLRAADQVGVTRAGWGVAAAHWNGATRAVGAALSVAGSVPPALPVAATALARRVIGSDMVPAWTPDLPKGGRPRRGSGPVDAPDALYLPACPGSMFAPAPGSAGVAEALSVLARRAGRALLVPDAIGGLCCATPWTSKGQDPTSMDTRVVAAVEAAQAGRELIVISDGASCTEGFRRLFERHGVEWRAMDAVAWAADALLARLIVTRRIGSLALHPTCSSTRMGLDAALLTVAGAIAERVVVPDGWGCCGFAGDRGMLHPELTAAATAAEARAVQEGAFDAWASVNRPCEIALSRATGKPYRHLLELLADATA